MPDLVGMQAAALGANSRCHRVMREPILLAGYGSRGVPRWHHELTVALRFPDTQKAFLGIRNLIPLTRNSIPLTRKLFPLTQNLIP
jgi:hypothetical protein